MILADTMKNQVEIGEKKHKVVSDSELRKKYVVNKKEDMKKRQNLLVKRSSDRFAMLEASNEIVLVLAKKYKLSTD